ncbi:GNAT family N-acetyltransferase [Sphingomonas sp. M1-B02]|uniref:GNAT family N-acetyltransferase n=1 Tax=Sphingomonas sp. M1-B02 TaxID=3114300 RepID=UPI002240AD10|nr:GNAT family N-acetyltransferase [Sphingomonas sp. S6-11]UZK66860.1 GNAT family N-acetyltransferase [Sphingomonas sp. S6-11]
MIATERLILRRWEERDRAPFHAICSDPQVMETLGPVMTRPQSDGLIDWLNGHVDRVGYSFWAIERREDGALLGFCGLNPGAEGTPIEGQVEIGWRLGRSHWGQGYAREAAQANLDWAWVRGIDTVVAITTPGNVRSWGLMERLGMRPVPGGAFAHPAAIERLRAHITYRIDRPVVKPLESGHG